VTRRANYRVVRALRHDTGNLRISEGAPNPSDVYDSEVRQAECDRRCNGWLIPRYEHALSRWTETEAAHEVVVEREHAVSTSRGDRVGTVAGVA
jgi:hypothetical protein